MLANSQDATSASRFLLSPVESESGQPVYCLISKISREELFHGTFSPVFPLNQDAVAMMYLLLR